MEFAIDKFEGDRIGCITGSKCSVLFPDRGDGKVGQTTYAEQLAMQRFFNFYDESGGGWQTEHGQMGEVFAHSFYQKNFNSEVKNGSFKRIEEWAGTCDALEENAGIDYKCPTSLHKWLSYLKGIDKAQSYQGQMYMFLFDRPVWKFCAYLMETEFMNNMGLTYPVPHNKRMIIVEEQKDLTFQARLEMNSPFVIKERDKFVELLKIKFA